MLPIPLVTTVWTMPIILLYSLFAFLFSNIVVAHFNRHTSWPNTERVNPSLWSFLAFSSVQQQDVMLEGRQLDLDNTVAGLNGHWMALCWYKTFHYTAHPANHIQKTPTMLNAKVKLLLMPLFTKYNTIQNSDTIQNSLCAVLHFYIALICLGRVTTFFFFFSPLFLNKN